MESETLVSPSPPQDPVTVLLSADDVSDPSSIPGDDDDDFETASESDSEVLQSAVKRTSLPATAARPIAKVTADDDADDESARVSDGPDADPQDEVLGEGNGNSRGRGEEDEVVIEATAEDNVLGGSLNLEDKEVVFDVSDGKDEIVGVEENGNSGSDDQEKGLADVDGGNRRVSDGNPTFEDKAVIFDELDGKDEILEVEGYGNLGGGEEDEKGISFLVESKDEFLGGECELSAENSVTEEEAAQMKDRLLEATADEKVLDEAVEMKDVEEASISVEDDGAAEESKAVERELGAVALKNIDAVEVENIDGTGEEPKAVDGEFGAVELQNVDGVKVVGRELGALEQENIDGMEEKTMEREFGALEPENVDGSLEETKVDESKNVYGVALEYENVDGSVEEPKVDESKNVYGVALEYENVYGAVEAKAAEREFVAVEPKNMDAVVPENIDGTMEELQAVEREFAVEPQNVDGVKVVERELGALEPENVDGLVKELRVDESKNVYGVALESENVDGAVEEAKSAEGEFVAVEPKNIDAVEPESSDGIMEEPQAAEREFAAVESQNVDGVKLVERELGALEQENIDGTVEEPKAVAREFGALEPENVDGYVESKVEESKNVYGVALESENVDGAVEEAKAAGREFIAVNSENVDGAMEEPMVVERELVAVGLENADGSVEEPKAAGSEFTAVEPGNVDGAVEGLNAGEKEVVAVEQEIINAFADASGADRSFEMEANAVPDPYQAPNESEAKSDDIESLPVYTEDSKSKEKEVSETLSVAGPYHNLIDPVAKPDDMESLPIHAEDSKSKEEKEDILGTLAVMEKNGTQEISGDIQIVEADADALEEVDDDENQDLDEADEEEDDTTSDQPLMVAILDSSETAKRLIKEMEEGSSSPSSISGFGSSQDFQHQMDGQIASDSDGEVDTDEEGNDKELFGSAALTALLKAATGTSQDNIRGLFVDRPAGLGNSIPALRPFAPHSTRQTLSSPSELVPSGESENDMDEEEKKLHEKVEAIRVKFLRLVRRLGNTPEDTVAAQVLYRLDLAEKVRRGRQMSRTFSVEAAKKKASLLESEGKEDLDFSCNILVLGKTGVGKSATINSIFGEETSCTNAFLPSTTSVKEISGVVDGVKIRVIDTPGLKFSVMDQATNGKILSSVKKYMKRCPPDIVLYVDRLDMQTRDHNDLPLLKTITRVLGSSIWFNAIVALTHAATAPPEGPNGIPLGYDLFVSQRSSVVQHSIRQAAGDMRLMNPVALVENHLSCRRNREGQSILPNGLSWRPQMLLLSYSSKILSEANSLLKLHDPSPSKFYGFRFRSPPLPYLLSTLLQSKPHPKLSTDQGGENGDSDIDFNDFSDDDDEDEYDQLPPFKPLRKAQISKLTKDQKRAYFDEYDYRVKLLQKKQWKDELRRMKEMKKRGKSVHDETAYGDMAEDDDQDGAPAAVPVPSADMVLPPSFDCDVPTYRYRFLEPTSQLLTRPVLDAHSWDHDCGYNGVSIEDSLAIAGRFPAAVAIQITKDKKEFNIHLDSSVSAKHGETGSTLTGFDIQSIHGKLAYILRGETKFKNLNKNKTTAGASVTFLGENIATGLKVEDQLSIGKRVTIVASTGAMRSQGDVAYGANLEARLREEDYPIGQAVSTLGLSLMKWRSDLALGTNLQTQLNIGRNSKVAVRVGLNNKMSGQITVKTSTSEQLQLALIGSLPVVVSIFRSIWPGENY